MSVRNRFLSKNMVLAEKETLESVRVFHKSIGVDGPVRYAELFQPNVESLLPPVSDFSRYSTKIDNEYKIIAQQKNSTSSRTFVTDEKSLTATCNETASWPDNSA
jgi:hypothetical protein